SPRRSLLSPLLFCLQSSVSHNLVPLSKVLQNFGILEHSVDRRTAEAYIAVIQHDSLSRCDCTGRLMKIHFDFIIADARHRHWHIVLAVPEFRDRKSTRLNSSHVSISYAVFCLKKKNKK